MEGDGNGWALCELGHRHWGRHGAAGLLLHTVDEAGAVWVLLQHRAAWSHHGDTWGLPGGALDSHEDAVTAALREAQEEAGLEVALVQPRHVSTEDHGGWSYTTVYADAPSALATTPNRESLAVRWVPLHEVPDRRMHPSFGAAWPRVRVTPTVLVVDAANVVGSRPDGWWRDRAGATTRLLSALARVRAATVVGAGGEARLITGVVAVLEGAAREATGPASVDLVRSRGSGDDALVAAVARLVDSGADVLAITADRALRARLASGSGSVAVAGPGWLRGRLAELGPPESRA